MSNSSLVSYTKLSPNHSGKRTHNIDRITPHCVVGQLSAESICGCFDRASIQASCNYGIGTDGRISLCVEEQNRSWCSSSNANDQRAVTIECASDKSAPYAMNNKVYVSLINLCVDICKRNGKKKLLWFGDKERTLNYSPKSDEMVLTVHRWFANKSCPGDWLYGRLGDLAAQVTSMLGGTSSTDEGNYPSVPFTVRVLIDDLNYRSEPSMDGTVNGQTGKGTFTIIEEVEGWGKLKSGAGWIWLGNKSYCTIQGSVSESTPPKKDDSFQVKVEISNLNIRTGAGTNHNTTGKFTGVGLFTIVEVRNGPGSTSGWGKLKSGAGWISLDYATRV
ncbi:MAG: N-acetylmuramoyl-L-alanine amidase [Erysipelotrichaceae bacterium]|nr:N-acetylmuramoyl-L-alanine amidase [Erysipelotrichaceae bacterium]